MNIEFSIESDSEGYIAFECPFCELQFRLLASEKQNSECEVLELFCPYCGLASDSNNFYTKEVVKQVEAIALNYMYDEINKTFGKMAKRINKSKFIKMEWKPLKKKSIGELISYDSSEEEFECKVCGKHQKVLYCSGKSKIFCSYCGVDINGY